VTIRTLGSDLETPVLLRSLLPCSPTSFECSFRRYRLLEHQGSPTGGSLECAWKISSSYTVTKVILVTTVLAWLPYGAAIADTLSKQLITLRVREEQFSLVLPARCPVFPVAHISPPRDRVSCFLVTRAKHLYASVHANPFRGVGLLLRLMKRPVLLGVPVFMSLNGPGFRVKSTRREPSICGQRHSPWPGDLGALEGAWKGSRIPPGPTGRDAPERASLVPCSLGISRPSLPSPGSRSS